MNNPWCNINEGAILVDVDDCELGPCCENVSTVRDLLMKASLHNGLIQRDVDDMFNNLYGCSGTSWFTPSREDTGDYPTPVWNKVLAQLPAEEILKALEEEREEDECE